MLGEQLPVKAYTTVKGLANNHINRIRQDSGYYVWFCTDVVTLSRAPAFSRISIPRVDEHLQRGAGAIAMPNPTPRENH